ncbi:MAG: peptidoglycan DD-metalloendopeptidase family protein [Duncaniella sp.]|nr:peptidoglycan DD-metalloendopeptidase family protein [Duncaniella sp.]
MKRARLLLSILIVLLILPAQPQAYAQTSRQRKPTTTSTTRKNSTTTRRKSTTNSKSTPAAQPQPQRSAENIRSEKDAARRRISETSNRLNLNGAELKRQLNNLNSLNADIERQQSTVNTLRERIDSLHSAIGTTNDTITILESDLEGLRLAYARALRQIQPSASSMNTLSFIFSASSFSEAYARVRYLTRFSRWRRQKALEIDRAIDRVAQRRQHLTALRHAQDHAYRQAREAETELTRKQDESRRLVDNLRRQDTQLRAELDRQKKQAQALDRELDRLIAQEQQRLAREEKARQEAQRRKNQKPSGAPSGSPAGADTPSARDIASAKAAERTAASTSAADLDGSSFAVNKGRLLFPVAGSYKIVRQFGRQPHPTQRNVVTDNSGIDLEVAPSTRVRAVYAGTVSAIFHQDGFQTIVMLRHGSYLTVYAGLASSDVRVGEKVTAGQTLGTVYSDPADSGRSILHFEVRNERTKLNPNHWVK